MFQTADCILIVYEDFTELVLFFRGGELQVLVVILVGSAEIELVVEVLDAC